MLLQDDTTAALLASIVHSSGDAIISTDRRGRIVSWNPAAAELFGRSSDEIIGSSITTLVPADTLPDLELVIERALEGESISDAVTVGLRADGAVLDLSVTISPLRDRLGEVVGMSVIARDTTERLELQRRVAADGRRLADAQASAGLGSFEIDLVSNSFTRSDEFWRIIGRSPSQDTAPDFDFVHPDDLTQVAHALQQVLSGRHAAECTHRVVRPDGEVRWVMTRTSRFREPLDPVIAGTMLDITERKEAELALEHLAFHDPLTGLANRSRITLELERQLSASHPTGRQVAVALLDIDQFKVINDSLGHSTGDLVLQAVAHRLAGALEGGEQIARFGGDEFAVVRGEVERTDEGLDLAERLLASLREPVVLGTRDFHLTMSVGVALSDLRERAEAMFLQADTAMYRAKDAGGDRAVLFDDELRRSSSRRLELRAALEHALDHDELTIAYQPVIDLATSEICGFEALVRWSSPSFGTVSPSEFIPIAEESGLIAPIGDWVLHEALGQLARWRAATGHEGLWVAVNLSARQLERPDLVHRVAGAITEAGVPPTALHLELTESVLMDRIDSSLETIQAMHRLGIRLGIDDFGTGYSSLSYLKRLPIDILKIDKSFVDGLGVDEGDSSIVQTVLALAHTLGMEVVAEGVETQTQCTTLVELGCSHAQGFLWGRGVSAASATALLQR